MSWKKFRDIFKAGGRDERYFVLGIDLGNATSSIAYFDLNQNMPEIIDISGGYGKPSVPTVMQYISESREWVFGEYAMTNRPGGREQTFHALVDKLGAGEYVEIDGRPVSIASILSLYMKELIGNCKNINPRAEIAGIVAAIPSYLSEEARSELLSVFKTAGYDRQFMGFVDDRECILNRHYYEWPAKKENALIIDFGAREVRGGIYSIDPTGTSKANAVRIDCRTFLFDQSMGTQTIEGIVLKLFKELYCRHGGVPSDGVTEQQMEQLEIFAYQHKDILFQKNPSEKPKPIKFYYNFAYPPFQATVSPGSLSEMVGPWRKKLTDFVREVIATPASDGGTITRYDIDVVLCVGGGFEMQWAREAVAEALGGGPAKVLFYRNAKGMIAEGASVIAAKGLEAIGGEAFEIHDKNRLEFDVGFPIVKDKKERFFPIIEANSFWWQERPAVLLLLNEETEQAVKIPIQRRNRDGERQTLGYATLDGLPQRPAGATRLRFISRCLSCDRLSVTVRDAGFGELFPAADYERAFEFVLPS